jgi:glucosylglycerate hydrolase
MTNSLTLAARAAYILRDNSTGLITKASPALYPHQWSWDAAFNAIGLATVELPRARQELDSLFAGQWRNGMVPHIVFDPTADGYWPGPGEWQCAEFTEEAPASPATSGICDPPVHAIAVDRLLAVAAAAGGSELELTKGWAAHLYPKLLAWHRFLARDRVDKSTGLMTLFHGWESGTDNSPRWDVPYANVVVGPDLPVYERRDKAHVSNACQRPTDGEYDRYVWLVEEAKRAGYDAGLMRETGSFQVGDVLFTAIFAAASDLLARLAAELRKPDDVAELRDYAAQARAAVFCHVDEASGLAADVDLRTGAWLRTETIAGFAPLIAGAMPGSMRKRLISVLTGPRWAGHPELRWPLPPSTSPCSHDFNPDCYWRGPVWPVFTWLLCWALCRDGETSVASRFRSATLEQLGDGRFAEYYHPFTGAPLGSLHQSWTTAVALDWLLEAKLRADQRVHQAPALDLAGVLLAEHAEPEHEIGYPLDALVVHRPSRVARQRHDRRHHL